MNPISSSLFIKGTLKEIKTGLKGIGKGFAFLVRVLTGQSIDPKLRHLMHKVTECSDKIHLSICKDQLSSSDFEALKRKVSKSIDTAINDADKLIRNRTHSIWRFIFKSKNQQEITQLKWLQSSLSYTKSKIEKLSNNIQKHDLGFDIDDLDCSYPTDELNHDILNITETGVQVDLFRNSRSVPFVINGNRLNNEDESIVLDEHYIKNTILDTIVEQNPDLSPNEHQRLLDFILRCIQQEILGAVEMPLRISLIGDFEQASEKFKIVHSGMPNRVFTIDIKGGRAKIGFESDFRLWASLQRTSIISPQKTGEVVKDTDDVGFLNAHLVLAVNLNNCTIETANINYRAIRLSKELGYNSSCKIASGLFNEFSRLSLWA